MKRIGILLSFAFLFVLAGCSKTEYTLALSEKEAVQQVEIICGGDKFTIQTSENVAILWDMIKGDQRTTTSESGHAAPEVDEYITLNMKYADGAVTVFVYQKDGKHYIQQPQNGIYNITAEEFGRISDFISGLKQPVSDMELASLKSEVKKLNPLDEQGESFEPGQLSNSQLLRYAFLQFNPKGNGFIDITFEILNRTYIRGSFGIETATPEDIVCSCGQTLAKYNASNDTYTWDNSFHYLDHQSDTFNEIKSAYKVEDRYFIELYKIFPDLMENSSTEVYNFYPTYNSAKEQAQPLFSVTNSDEFTQAVNSLADDVKVTYRLTFVRKGTLKLINYEILE